MPQIDRVMIELCRDDLTRKPARMLTLDQPILNPHTQKMVTNVPLLNCPAGRFLRPVDLLIISIGGNDVGFVPLIVDVLTKEPPPYFNTASEWNANRLGASVLRFLARIVRGHDVKEAQRKALELPARFAALRKAIEPIPIRRNAAGEPNIVLTAFPKVEFNEDGRLCGEADPRERLEGFNVGGVLAIDVLTLRPISQFANNTLYPATKEAARIGNWHFIDAHRGPFSKHGICAQKRTGTGVSAAENLMLPYYHADIPRPDRWSDFEPFAANRETDFRPERDTRAYASRERWFRTLNDICLFVQFKANGAPPPPTDGDSSILSRRVLAGRFIRRLRVMRISPTPYTTGRRIY